MKNSFFLAALLLVIPGVSFAQEFANIEYLCADWGPAMTLSTKTNAPPVFSETEDEVYFLKQVGRFTRKMRPILEPLFSNSPTEDSGHGISIYLCKMKPDGSEKTEIKELWKNPNYPIGTQDQSTWMNVNVKTHKIVLSVLYAGSDATGLWTMNLDGSEFKQIIRPERGEKLDGFDHPSWTPDGQQIVFEEIMRGMHPQRYNLAICNATGGEFHRLLNGTDKIKYTQPSVSPDGTKIVYAVISSSNGGLWIIDTDGNNAHLLPNPNGTGKRPHHGGIYPTWSPDGTKIFAMSAGIVDVVTGKQLLYGRPVVQNMPQLQGKHATVVMPHWGKGGLLCSGWGGGIQLADERLEKLWILATSDLEKVE